MQPQHLDLLVSVSTPTVSPDGSTIVTATSRPSFTTDSYVGQLWQIPVDGSSPPRRFTRGVRDAAPQYSPDGTLIAFLRPDDRGRPQLALLDARGGEPLIITNRHLGVSSFTWTPDSSRIVFTSATARPGRYGTVEGVSAGAEDPRVVTTNQTISNGVGWSYDRLSALYVVTVPPVDSEPFLTPVGRVAAQQAQDSALDTDESRANDGVAGDRLEYPTCHVLSDPAYSASQPVVSPDGRHVYFTSAQHDRRDDDLITGIYRVELHAGVEVKDKKEWDVTPPQAQCVLGGAEAKVSFSSAAFGAQGDTLFALGHDLGPTGRDFVARNVGVYAVPTASLPALTAELLTDLEHVDYAPTGALVPHGSGVLAIARVRGAGELHLIEPAEDNHSTATVTPVVTGQRVVTGVAAADKTVAMAYTDPVTPGEIAVVVDGGEFTVLTDFAAALRDKTQVVEQVEITASAPDGYPVHGWLYKPSTPGPHPVLLNIHGGPFADYQWAYFDEAQVYAQAGYAVVQANPRGSAGYGQAHGRVIKGAMGTVDKDDVLALLDAVTASDPDLDGDRVGVLGGSYGGYLTAWIIAHDHRFSGAIVERGFLDPLTFAGPSDIGWFFAQEYTGVEVDQVLAQSPMAVVDQVRTPTCVMHSELDLRCPLEQAQRYALALRHGGVESQFVVFPGENHELSRSGTPWHRRQRFDAILGWWDKYLPVT
nr:S9 family peptidase [Jonesia quinghaiensis]